MNTKQKTAGFTLVELLVVMSIIAMLASIVLSAISDARKKATDTAKVRSTQEIRSALQLYFSEKGGYPITSNFPSALITGKYIPSINTTGVTYKGLLSDGTECTVGICNSYHLGIVLDMSNNTVLTGDKDSSHVFEGNSINCVDALTTGQSDKCYDIEP